MVYFKEKNVFERRAFGKRSMKVHRAEGLNGKHGAMMKVEHFDAMDLILGFILI